MGHEGGGGDVAPSIGLNDRLRTMLREHKVVWYNTNLA